MIFRSVNFGRFEKGQVTFFLSPMRSFQKIPAHNKQLSYQHYSGLCKKKRISYNLEFLHSTYQTRNKNSPFWNSATSDSPWACTIEKSPIKESVNGLQANWYSEFISCKPVNLKRAIDSKDPILSIKLCRCMEIVKYRHEITYSIN